MSFNSRTREGCDTTAKFISVSGTSFNSRTREGCDTSLPSSMVCGTGFNSRTREGCDATASPPTSWPWSFNSRTREGCDCSPFGLGYPCQRVSIHAPGRGATSPRSSVSFLSVFQFTHPGGVRLRWTGHSNFNAMFQFTHPGGVRPRCAFGKCGRCWFQFTHPGGVRHPRNGYAKNEQDVSIHAPGRGATRYVPCQR